jgi:hypothetical protein
MDSEPHNQSVGRANEHDPLLRLLAGIQPIQRLYLYLPLDSVLFSGGEEYGPLSFKVAIRYIPDIMTAVTGSRYEKVDKHRTSARSSKIGSFYTPTALCTYSTGYHAIIKPI